MISKNDEKKHPALKSLLKNLIALLIFLAIPFFAYRSCTSDYDKYAFYVHANDEALFKNRLVPSDVRIIDRGRRLKKEIIIMDKDVDSGDGAYAGKNTLVCLRWYRL